MEQSRHVQTVVITITVALFLIPGCEFGKPTATMSDEERLKELLKYLRENEFPLEKREAVWDKSYAIEESADGSFAHTGFVIFPLNSSDAENRAELHERNPASIYNPRCKIAMFVPGVTGPPNTPDSWTPPEHIARHAGKNSSIVMLFRRFNLTP